MAELAIETDRENMRIRVGETVFDRPHLLRVKEMDFSVKQQIVPSDEYRVEKLHKFYCERLGPKFNRRFQAANYWLWLGGKMDRNTENSLRYPGRHWRHYNSDLVFYANKSLPYVKEAEADNLHQLVPAIIMFGLPPAAIRREIGGASWRAIAHNSKTRNQAIMQVAARMPEDHWRKLFVRLLDFPSGVLPGVMGADDDEAIAARLTPRKNAIVFRQTTDLVRDTRRMVGDDFNADWGLARMRREHEDAVRNLRSKRYSKDEFCPAWEYAANGFTATLLTSKYEIGVEGDLQRHCVGSYANVAAGGSYAVLRIDGKERATAGLHKNGKAWQVEQVYGACNLPVSAACREFAIDAAVKLARRNDTLQVAA
jgi:hypothetical protein